MAFLHRGLAAAFLAATACAHSATGPAEPTPTHPQGVVVARTALSAPFGVAVSSTGTVFVTQLDSGALARFSLPDTLCSGRTRVGSAPTDVAFNSTGTTAYVTNQLNHNVGIVNVATGVQVDTIPITSGDPYRVLVSPDDQTLYVSTNSATVVAIRLATKTVATTYTLAGAINGLALHPTQPVLYATSFTSAALFRINLTTGVVGTVPLSGMPQEVVVSKDGSRLYVANENGPVDVRDAGTGASITTVIAPSDAFGMKLSPDGAVLYAGVESSGIVWAVDTGTLAATPIAVGGVPRRIAFDRYGTTAIVADLRGKVVIIR